ncbi:hypothetical protein AAY473_037143, partial [Plecturocebus cupreus]
MKRAVPTQKTQAFAQAPWFSRRSLALLPGWSAVAGSQLTATSSWVQGILLPQPPNGVPLCCPGWSAVMQSHLTATPALKFKTCSFLLPIETGFHHLGQAGLELLISSDLPASASQSAGITGVNHCTWPLSSFLNISFTPQAMLDRVQWHNLILSHRSLQLPGPSNSCASASQAAGITSMGHLAQLSFVFLIETGFHHVGQAALELLTS